jgi:predicted transcriptional regulator
VPLYIHVSSRIVTWDPSVQAKTIKKINQKDNTNNTSNKIEWKLIRNIRNTLAENELIITKADKGKTIVILTKEDYTQKGNNFIQENQFVVINNNPTKDYQKAIKHTMTQCNNIIPKENKWKYINMNPTAPTLRATIKLHKQNTPIRPIINWRNAPA